MTPAPESAEVYEVRGNEIRLSYDEESHSATISSDALDGRADDIEAELKSIGVYTRARDIVDRGDNTVSFTIKPASGLELRDENGTLRKRPVGNPTDSSVITKQRDSYRYSATVPVDALNELGIYEKGKVALYLSVEDGHLAFYAEPDEDAAHAMMARIESGGVIRIPSVIGAAGDLDGHAVDWELADDGHSLFGVTSLDLEDVDTSEDETGRHAIVGIAKKEQEVTPSTGEYEGRTWTQEHFQTYIRAGQAERLGWGEKDLVDMKFARDGDTLLLVVSRNIRPEYTEDTPCVKSLSAYAKAKEAESGRQLNFYLPNTLVYSMSFAESESIRWAVIDGTGRLAGWKP